MNGPERGGGLAIAVLFVVALVVSAASPHGANATAAKLKVAATTSMIADAVREIGGERVDVTALMGPGVDPHSYRQTRSDIVALVRADVVFWNGLYLEAQLEDFFADLAKRRRVYAVGEAVPPSRLIGHKSYKGRFDPHVWMDPERWSRVVEEVRDRLVEISPDDKQLFEGSAERYLKEIATVGDYARETLATVPQAQRVLLTAHDAFNYFGDAYGYEVIGIQGISTESEAGLNRIREIVGEIVSRNVGAVFVETSVADRNVRAVVEGAAARGRTVAIGGELFSDAMGRPGTYEGTYVGMIDHNVTTIARALGGNAPQRGMAGRLSVSG